MSNRSDVLAAYQTYLDAFMASDEQAIRDCLQWPCTFLLEGRVESHDAFPYSPTELKRKKDWETSVGLEIDVVAVSRRKAHVLLRNCKRLRPDGSLIEQVRRSTPLPRQLQDGRYLRCRAWSFPPERPGGRTRTPRRLTSDDRFA